MNFFVDFFKTLPQTIYSPKFYQSILKKSFGQAIGYFFFLIFLLTIVRSISPIFLFETVGQKIITNAVTESKNAYPVDLEVKIHNGIVSTNVEEPYFIKWPKSFGDMDTKTAIVIDTHTPFSIEQFRTYNATMWISKNAFSSAHSDSQIRTIDLSDVDDVTLNKKLVDSLFATVLPIVHALSLAIPVLIVIGLFLGYTLKLVYLFFIALLVMVIGKMLRQQLSYWAGYKISLYAITGAFLADIVLEWLRLSSFPFMGTLLTIIIVVVNFSSIKVVTKKTRSKK